MLIETKQLTFDPEVREKEVAAVPVDHISREAIVPRKPVAHASLARDTPAARTILYSFPRRRTADSRRHRPELRFQQPYPAVELIPLCPKLLQLPLYRLPPAAAAAAAAAAHPSAVRTWTLCSLLPCRLNRRNCLAKAAEISRVFPRGLGPRK